MMNMPGGYLIIEKMSSMDRVLTTLGHEEPDRVPYFLLLTGHGANLLGMHPKKYFSNGEYVAEAQLKMQKTYGHDCLYPFFYASLELEAWGGSSIFYDDAPPNAGKPIINDFEQIESLDTPDVSEFSEFDQALKAISILHDRVGSDIPIIGVVMSPFSLPVMQMGFDRYFDLIYEDRERFDQLMKLNEEFCINWANSQLEAGATAICYFDPVSSSTIIPRDIYLETGLMVAQKTLSKIKGPTATHFASGSSLPIIEDVAKTGTSAVGVSTFEDLGKLKEKSKGKISLIGNLNAIEMIRWTPEQTDSIVKDSIEKAAAGGGYILSDNHGEISWPVSHQRLLDIGKAVRKYSNY